MQIARNVQSGAVTCYESFVMLFLRVPQANHCSLGSTAVALSAQQPVDLSEIA